MPQHPKGKKKHSQPRGWTRQFTIEADRASEFIELFESLGNEVRLEPVAPDQLPEKKCTACVMAACDRYVVLYTRALKTEGQK